jgi:hypothetical protein
MVRVGFVGLSFHGSALTNIESYPHPFDLLSHLSRLLLQLYFPTSFWGSFTRISVDIYGNW